MATFVPPLLETTRRALTEDVQTETSESRRRRSLRITHAPQPLNRRLAMADDFNAR